jgi:hypothetical protein
MVRSNNWRQPVSADCEANIRRLPGDATSFLHRPALAAFGCSFPPCQHFGPHVKAAHIESWQHVFPLAGPEVTIWPFRAPVSSHPERCQRSPAGARVAFSGRAVSRHGRRPPGASCPVLTPRPMGERTARSVGSGGARALVSKSLNTVSQWTARRSPCGCQRLPRKPGFHAVATY